MSVSNNYKKAVGVFGIAIPMVVMTGLALFALSKASDVEKKYLAKERLLKREQIIKMQNAALKKQVKEQEEALNGWKELIAGESPRTFLQHWKETEKQFKSDEFIRELPVWQNRSTGIGKGVGQEAGQVVMTFDATYRAMQTALLEMETRLPQMQLDSIEISPSKQGGLLNFKTQHTVWANE